MPLASLFLLSAGWDASIYWKAVVVLGVATLAYLGYTAWHNKDDFRVTVRKGRVDYHGHFPPGKRGDATAFLLRDVAPRHTLRVIGNWTDKRVLRITVQGRISAGDIHASAIL